MKPKSKLKANNKQKLRPRYSKYLVLWIVFSQLHQKVNSVPKDRGPVDPPKYMGDPMRKTIRSFKEKITAEQFTKITTVCLSREFSQIYPDSMKGQDAILCMIGVGNMLYFAGRLATPSTAVFDDKRFEIF